ncbi:Pycsar system effector family protein [Streptomyces sp. NPDC002755]|uniref:Pycsar system effector family protein n=1 Tax=Streptomyces sp. NPDC002884 TaxID=3154544 RepID=UPI0033252A59
MVTGKPEPSFALRGPDRATFMRRTPDDAVPSFLPVGDLMPQPSGASPETEKAVETAWRIHGAIGEWTARVDAKASFALAFESAAVGAIIALSGKNYVFDNVHARESLYLLWVGSGLIVVSAIFAAVVVVPRLRGPALQAEASANFIYFGHLMHREANELAESLRNTDLLPVLSRQLIVMSGIAWTKHRNIQISFILFAFGAVLVVIAGILA